MSVDIAKEATTNNGEKREYVLQVRKKIGHTELFGEIRHTSLSAKMPEEPKKNKTPPNPKNRIGRSLFN